MNEYVIMFQWSDENVWKIHRRVHLFASHELQLNKAREEWKESKAKYPTSYDAEFTIVSWDEAKRLTNMTDRQLKRTLDLRELCGQ